MLSAYATTLPPSSMLPAATSPLLVVDAHAALLALAAALALGVAMLVARWHTCGIEGRWPLRALAGRSASRRAA